MQVVEKEQEAQALPNSPGLSQPRRRDTYAKYVFMYGGYYFAYAMFSALISVYLIDKGLSAGQASLIISASWVLSMLVQPLIGTLLDKGDKKRITIAILVLSAVIGVAFVFCTSFASLLLVYGLTVALWNALNPYFEKVATASRYPYRSIRIWGTIGYAVGAQIAGIIYDEVSPDAMYYLFAASIFLSAVGVWNTQGTSDAQPEITRAQEQTLEYRKAVLANKRLGVYMLIAALFYASTNLSFTYLPVFYQQEGLSVSLTSTVLFAATLMELPIIFFSSAYMNRFTSKQLLLTVFGALIVQFATYAFLPWLAVQIVMTLLLRAASTMMFIMLNIKIVSAIVPTAYQLSALTLVSALSRSLVTAVVQNLGGYVLDTISIQALYAMLCGMAVAGLALVAAARFPEGDNEVTF